MIGRHIDIYMKILIYCGEHKLMEWIVEIAYRLTLVSFPLNNRGATCCTAVAYLSSYSDMYPVNVIIVRSFEEDTGRRSSLYSLSADEMKLIWLGLDRNFAMAHTYCRRVRRSGLGAFSNQRP
jgi:hypothetical protein